MLNKYCISGVIYVGLVMMELLKGKLRESGVPDQSQSAALNGCNLDSSSLEKILSIDEIIASICSERRKKPGKRLVQSTSSFCCFVQDHFFHKHCETSCYLLPCFFCYFAFKREKRKRPFRQLH